MAQQRENIKEVKRSSVETLYDLTARVNEASEHASDLLKEAQDRYGKKTHKVMRPNGKVEKLTEKQMWDEIFYHPKGAKCESGIVLSKKRPDVFQAFAAFEQTKVDLKKYCMQELGVDYTQMQLSDYFKITIGLFEMLLNERLQVFDKEKNITVNVLERPEPQEKEMNDRKPTFMEKIMESLGR